MYNHTSNSSYQPHLLSYSSVTPGQSPSYLMEPRDLTNSGHSGRDFYKINREDRNFHKNEKDDLAFLRNTVGSDSSQDRPYQASKSQYSAGFQKMDASLRHTTSSNSTYDFRDMIERNKTAQSNANPNYYQKHRKSTTQNYQDQPQTYNVRKNKDNKERKHQQNDLRLEKIMMKYQKKDQTAQALKLLEQLKQLKKKQVQLKRHKDQDSSSPNGPVSSRNYQKKVRFNDQVKDSTSPSHFSKKNKIQYFTPSSYQKKDLSTTTGSPQIEAYEPHRYYGVTDGKGYSYENNELYNSPQLTYSQPSLQSSRTDNNRNGKYQKSGYSRYNLKSIKQKSVSPIFGQKDKKDRPVSPLPFNKYSSQISSNSSVDNTMSNSYHNIQQSNNSSGFPTYSKTQRQSAKLNVSLSSKRIPSSKPSYAYGEKNFTHKNLTIKDFKLGKSLGEGKFGTVHQAIEKRTGTMYALKKVPKAMIKSHFMVDQFLLQVKIQSFLNHQNILYLHTCFDDRQHVYIVLEYMEEGTLFLHLKKNNILDQQEAALKLREIASAIQYLHQNDIAHRDLKPENIVMSHGVCKLCDFGWATLCDQRRKTYCGTFDYAAPEILQGTEYDMSVDLWCLGILAYQILVGKAPFYHISRKQTMKKIMNCQQQKIHYPSSMSKNARSFIQKLLKKNPDERLKSEDLLIHPFLKNAIK